ncbi:MAG: peptidylprolyl isomerase [Phycisphaerales bacterium]|jgi:cyclophilin family peptidyl-prolyl cis-trans isomerase|nr:peptidylprolyl isomerase [Phycisphaerales bacterium]
MIRRTRPFGPGFAPAWFDRFEQLEARMLLSGALPALSDLENPANPVVRFDTDLGCIDFELFVEDAPRTVQNFLNYVSDADYVSSFFHRLDNDFVLQGGGFRWSDSTGLSRVPQDDPIQNEFGRSNLERTIAMAKTNDPDSATSQFFINLGDNSGPLDNPFNSGGFTVFGRVVGDASWEVVQQIVALSIFDLRTRPSFQGPGAGAMGEVPMQAPFGAPVPITTAPLVMVQSATLVRAAAGGFTVFESYFPDGFKRDDAIRETISLANPNMGDVSYQLIATYARGRTTSVVSAGTISTNQHLTIQTSGAGSTTALLPDRGYALTLVTYVPSGITNAMPVVASIARSDFGATTGESFFEREGYTDAQLRNWDFAYLEKNATSVPLFAWQNLSDTDGTVTVTFISDGGTQLQRTLSLEAGRRGGLLVSNLAALPNATYAVRVRGTVPIVVALTDYDRPTNPATPQDTAGLNVPGWTLLGTPGGGSARGVLAGAEFIETTAIISAYNPGATVAVIAATLRVSGGMPIERPAILIVPPGLRRDATISVSNTGIPANQSFSIVYSANNGSTPVTVQLTSVATTGRGTVTGGITDGYSAAFTTHASNQVAFAGGYLDPSASLATNIETIGVFNPFSDATTNILVRFTFLLSDGTTVDGGSVVVGPQERQSVFPGASSVLKDRLATLGDTGYTLVASAFAGVGFTTPVPVIADLMRRYDSTDEWIQMNGVQIGDLIELDDPSLTGAMPV